MGASCCITVPGPASADGRGHSSEADALISSAEVGLGAHRAQVLLVAVGLLLRFFIFPKLSVRPRQLKLYVTVFLRLLQISSSYCESAVFFDILRRLFPRYASEVVVVVVAVERVLEGMFLVMVEVVVVVICSAISPLVLIVMIIVVVLVTVGVAVAGTVVAVAAAAAAAATVAAPFCHRAACSLCSLLLG